MEEVTEFLPKEVSNLSEFIQEVQKLDMLKQLYDNYSCNYHIYDNSKNLLKESEVSELKTNSDEIYIRINFIEKLLLINKIETAYRPIDKLTLVTKDIKQINAILESDTSLKEKYIEISEKIDNLNESLTILLKESKEILYLTDTNDFKIDNEKIKKSTKIIGSAQSKFLEDNKEVYSSLFTNIKEYILNICEEAVSFSTKNKNSFKEFFYITRNLLILN